MAVRKRSTKTGFPPGALIHIGEKKAEKVSINILDYDEIQFEEKEAKTIEECFPFKEKPTVTWININGLHEVEVIEKIGKNFDFHPLLVEDILNTEQRPKIEDFETHIYLVLKMFYYDDRTNQINSEQISIIFGRNFVISGKELEVVFKKILEKEAERFRLKMNFSDEFEVEVYHAEENEGEKDIQAVPELKSALNILRMRELGEKIQERTNKLYPGKKRLDYIHLDGKDVIEENIVFELMQKVAELFAPIIADIKEHSPFGEELSLKAEDETGNRSEIYLKKSQVMNKLDAIMDKGNKLSEILGMG